MKLSEIPKEELELMGYDDIAYLVLQESGKKMKLIDIFKKINKVLELPDSAVENHLVDFFEVMSTNKKFVMLKNGFWDLQSRHKADFVIEDGDDELESELEDNEEDIVTEEDSNEDIFYEQEDETDDSNEDDLADLVVIDGDEEDEQNL